MSIWFPPRQVPMASGFFATAGGFGAAMGLITGPHFGGWQPAFLYSGIVAIVVAILWTVFGRSVPEGVEIHMPPVLEGVKNASHSRNIWILAAPVELPEIGHAYVGGAAGIMLSFLALGAVVIPNLVITPIVAEGTLSAFTSGFLVFSILLVALAVVAIFMKETGRKTG